MFTRSVLCLLMVCGGALAADEWTDSFAALEPAALAREADLIALSAPVISRVPWDSVAATMDLRVGDRLIGQNGLRVYGCGEWDLVRCWRPVRPGSLEVVVWRDGAAFTCATTAAVPVQRLGCDFDEPRGALDQALEALASPACGWTSFPRRAGVALLRWQAAAPAQADRAWISALARLYALLADQRWAEAERLVVQPPDPELARLADFYHRVAARHAHGEQEPDPKCFGQPRPWYTVHYPYPRLVLPDLGTFTHPDAGFMTALAQLRTDPCASQRAGHAAASALGQLADETSYAYHARQAALDAQCADWPYRPSEVFQREQRAGLIAALRAGLAKGDAQSAWCQYCLICPEMADHPFDKEEPPTARRVLDLVRAVRARSPLLAYLGCVNIVQAQALWNETPDAEHLSEELPAHPFTLTAAPSRLLDHLRARSPGLDLQVIAPADCQWPRQLARVHAALYRPAAVEDVRRRLRAAAPKAAGQEPQPLAPGARAALLGEAAGCFAETCTAADAALLARSAAPGCGAGLRLDAFSEVLYRQADDVLADVTWMKVLMDEVDRMDGEGAAVARMRSVAAALPWGRPEAVAPAVRAAYADWGTTASTLVLAEACAAHGQAALAEELRERVRTLYARIQQFCERTYITGKTLYVGDQKSTERHVINRDQRDSLYIRLLSAGVLSPAMLTATIEVGEGFSYHRGKDDASDAVQLALALAYLAAGRREDALAELMASFVVAQTYTGMNYWCDGQLITAAIPCRTWILRRLLAAQPLEAAQREALKAVVKPALIDDAFAGLLGLQRGKLPADPTPRKAGSGDF